MIKNQTKLIDRETSDEWRVERRTWREDVLVAGSDRPQQRWTLILCNKQGHRRFIAEERITQLYEVVGAVPAVAAAKPADDATQPE
jgi:hypothetical protein